MDKINLNSDFSNQTLGVLSAKTLVQRTSQFLYATQFAAFNDTMKQKCYGPLNEIILSCTFNFLACNVSDFTFYSSINFGPCLRYTPSQILKSQGQIVGLRIELLLDPPISSSFKFERGLNIVIKNRSEYISSLDGFPIKTGQNNVIQVSKTVSENLPAPYTKCVVDGAEHSSEIYNYILGTNMTYSQE